MKAYVLAAPDAFPENSGIGVNCDEEGNYSLILPERTYNCLICNNITYGKTTLEPWAWHIIVDSDQRLDFTIGNGEVYNLMVWASNGGGRSYFVYFRPMVLFPAEMKRSSRYPVEWDGQKYSIIDICPPLGIKDLQVTIDGQKARILSLQKCFETMPNQTAMPAYLAQVDAENLTVNGKKTVRLEYHKSIETKGGAAVFYSMGYYQFLPNFSGHSNYR